jgi:hypothetical protein
MAPTLAVQLTALCYTDRAIACGAGQGKQQFTDYELKSPGRNLFEEARGLSRNANYTKCGLLSVLTCKIFRWLDVLVEATNHIWMQIIQKSYSLKLAYCLQNSSYFTLKSELSQLNLINKTQKRKLDSIVCQTAWQRNRNMALLKALDLNNSR